MKMGIFHVFFQLKQYCWIMPLLKVRNRKHAKDKDETTKYKDDIQAVQLKLSLNVNSSWNQVRWVIFICFHKLDIPFFYFWPTSTRTPWILLEKKSY